MWGVAFAAGVLLSVIGQWLAHTALGSAEAERGSGESGSRERAEKRAPGPTGQPWGDLEITPLVLERPEEMFEQYPQSPVVRWYLPEDSFGELTALVRDSGLSAGQKASLLDTNRWEHRTNGWRIRPPLEVVRDLPEADREKVYGMLSRYSQNPQHYPFAYREDRFEALLTESALPEDVIALARRLSYRGRGLRCFCDGQLFEQLTSSNVTRQLFKALLRVPTMMVRLHLDEATDIDRVVAYWGGANRAREIKPLLRSLAKLPGGGSINISHLLPPMPRLRLYTYPPLTNHLELDCFWSSFNFFGKDAEYRMGDSDYSNHLLDRDYFRWHGGKQFGDLMILVESEMAMHACVYIADDIYFTKNGTDPNQPWVFMHMTDIMAQYASNRPQEWRVFRRKVT